MEEERLLKDCVFPCFSNYSLTLDECNCNVIFMDVYHLKMHHTYSNEICESIEFLKMLWLVVLVVNRFIFFPYTGDSNIFKRMPLNCYI